MNQGSLRHTVDRVRSDQCRCGADIDHPAPALLHHGRRRLLNEQERRLQVRCQHCIPLVLLQFEKRRSRERTRVVDQDRYRAELPGDLGGEMAGLRRDAQIGAERGCGMPLAADLRRHLLRGCKVRPAMDRHVGAQTSELAGDLRSGAGG